MTPFPSPAARWILLLVASAVLVCTASLAGLPGAPLLGGMLAALALALVGLAPRLPSSTNLVAQALIGSLVGTLVDPRILAQLVANGPVILVMLAATVGAAVVTGFLVEASGRLPPGTGTWGTLPGAAPAMITLAGAFGCDMRFVAVMQYMRVVVVVCIASAVANHLPGGQTGSAIAPAAPVDPVGLLVTAAITLSGALLASRTKFPAAGVLVPMFLMAVLASLSVPVAYPDVLAFAAFILVGWTIGTRFDRQVIGPIIAALPVMIAAIVFLVVLCALIAVVLTLVLDIAFITAFLATSPGGLDAVTILAVHSSADVAFVLLFQTLRLFVTILAGSAIARYLEARSPATGSRLLKREETKDDAGGSH